MKQETIEKKFAEKIIKIIEDRKIEKEKQSDEEKHFDVINEIILFINEYSEKKYSSEDLDLEVLMKVAELIHIFEKNKRRREL